MISSSKDLSGTTYPFLNAMRKVAILECYEEGARALTGLTLRCQVLVKTGCSPAHLGKQFGLEISFALGSASAENVETRAPPLRTGSLCAPFSYSTATFT